MLVCYKNANVYVSRSPIMLKQRLTDLKAENTVGFRYADNLGKIIRSPTAILEQNGGRLKLSTAKRNAEIKSYVPLIRP